MCIRDSPYALLDAEGKILWMNDEFLYLTGKDQKYRRFIGNIFPEVTMNKLPLPEEVRDFEVAYQDHDFRLNMRRVEIDELLDGSQIIDADKEKNYLIAAYLFDETELKKYMRKNQEEQLVTGLLYLDNYEEALESVEEVRSSLLIALIDRKINKYFASIDGVVKKLEKDKYFLVMRRKSLEQLKEKKFNILEEVKSVHEKFQKLTEVAGSKYEAKVGFVKDYDNVWDSQLDVWHEKVEWQSQLAIFEAAQKTHTPMDYIYLREDVTAENLKQYTVLFYPHPVLISEERRAVLEEYVKNGGCLVLGCRSGYKDMYGRCVMDKLPGKFAEMSGVDIPEYTLVSPDNKDIVIDWDGTKLEAAVFNDQLAAVGEHAEVLGRYENCYYAGEPGLIKNAYGEGTVYYFGAAFSEKTAEVFLEKLGVKDPYKEKLEIPETCELAVRKKDDIEYCFVLNYKDAEAEIQVKEEMTDLYTGEKVSGTVVLKPFEVRVLK